MKSRPTPLRRKLSNAAKLITNELLDKLCELDSPIVGEVPAHPDSNVAESEIDGLPFSVRGFAGRAAALFHVGNVRTNTENARNNAHITHKVVAVCAHSTHIIHRFDANETPSMSQQNSATKGYAGKKKRTNLSLDANLVEIAMKHFPSTKHGSLSGFVENAIRSNFRANAPKLRQSGYKLPDAIFEK